MKQPIEMNSSETVLLLLIKTGVEGIGNDIHLTFRAFWADLGTLRIGLFLRAFCPLVDSLENVKPFTGLVWSFFQFKNSLI